MDRRLDGPFSLCGRGGGVKEHVSAENGIIPLIRIKQSIYTLYSY